jgi:rare lipoprotein A
MSASADHGIVRRLAQSGALQAGQAQPPRLGWLADTLVSITAALAIIALVQIGLSVPSPAALPPEPRAVTRTMSVYSDRYVGHTMANGERHRADALTVASNDWRLGTRLRLTRASKTLEVTVTDRMARRFTGVRIDASQRVWRELSGGAQPGLRQVRVEVVR